MKRLLIFLLPLLLFTTGCDDTTKPGDVKTSGTVTIDNNLYGTNVYYALGFSFAKAEKISSLSNPKPDVILELEEGPPYVFMLSTSAGINGFHLAGEFASESLAIQFFDNLHAIEVSDWDIWANPVKPNQVWVYRSADEHYAKIRIISTSSQDLDPRDYGECTFEWVYQPDGTLTFPAE